MSLRFKNHYNQVTSQDLIHKFNYKNHFQLPNFQNTHVNLSDPTLVNDKFKLYDYIFLLESITNKKSYISKSSKNKIQLKIKKNTIIGCHIHLTKKQSFLFLEYLILFILPFQKNFVGIKVPNTVNSQITFHLKNWYQFLPKKHKGNFEFYQRKLNSLQILLKFQSKNCKLSENLCFLTSFNFPIVKI